VVKINVGYWIDGHEAGETLGRLIFVSLRLPSLLSGHKLSSQTQSMHSIRQTTAQGFHSQYRKPWVTRLHSLTMLPTFYRLITSAHSTQASEVHYAGSNIVLSYTSSNFRNSIKSRDPLTEPKHHYELTIEYSEFTEKKERWIVPEPLASEAVHNVHKL
jgi:hypothetical protein